MTEVRIAGPDDVAALARLRQRWDGREEPGFQRRMAKWLAAEGARRTTWLAIDGAEPIGMGSMFEYRRMPHPGEGDRCWGYIGNMFVLEARRGAGAGSALLREMVAAGRARGYVRLVLSPSERAVPFYERAGFRLPDASVAGDRLLVLPL